MPPPNRRRPTRQKINPTAHATTRGTAAPAGPSDGSRATFEEMMASRSATATTRRSRRRAGRERTNHGSYPVSSPAGLKTRSISPKRVTSFSMCGILRMKAASMFVAITSSLVRMLASSRLSARARRSRLSIWRDGMMSISSVGNGDPWMTVAKPPSTTNSTRS